MAIMVNDRIDDPSDADVEYYVGLEHLDPESLTIRRWGSPSDVAATKLRFRAGDIIFGRRRVYQRKLAVAGFDGICSAHAMVLRANPAVALPEFLPFFMQSDLFMERAKEISVGSLSPTINWKTLAREEFALPPLDEQRRIASLLRAGVETLWRLQDLARVTQQVYRAAVVERFTKPQAIGVTPADWKRDGWKYEPLKNLVLASAPICYGIVQVGDYDAAGIPTLAIKDLKGDFSTDVHRTMQSVESRYVRSRVSPRDVLVSIKATIGEISIVPDGFMGNISRDLARLRFNTEKVRPRFFLHLYRAPRYTEYVRSLLVGSTRAELSIAALRDMVVPFPALEEQDRLIAEMDAITNSDASVTARVSYVSRMNHALLERAVAPRTGHQ